MKVFKAGLETLYIANSMLKEERSMLRCLSKTPPQEFAEFLIEGAYIRLGVGGYKDEKKCFKNLCRDILSKEFLSVAILYAHGDTFFGRWCYNDGWIPSPVQEWVSKKDGKYDILLLHSCNPTDKKPKVKKSLMVMPTDEFSTLSSMDENYRLVIPGEGYIPINRSITQKLPEENLMKTIKPYIHD